MHRFEIYLNKLRKVQLPIAKRIQFVLYSTVCKFMYSTLYPMAFHAMHNNHLSITALCRIMFHTLTDMTLPVAQYCNLRLDKGTVLQLLQHWHRNSRRFHACHKGTINVSAAVNTVLLSFVTAWASMAPWVPWPPSSTSSTTLLQFTIDKKHGKNCILTTL